MTTDLERIKTQISIAALVAKSGLTVIGKGHTLTTAEHDSLKIFTNNNSWTWYSQSGQRGKALGGSVIDWYMHTNKCNQGEAIRALQSMLDGGVIALSKLPTPQVEKQIEVWRSPTWQEDAKSKLERAQETLWLAQTPTGEAGRAFLVDRGISLDAAIAWGLGFAMAWNPKAEKMMPALWLPYMNRQITAIQYRFVGVGKDDATAVRFSSLKGSERYLCGLHLCVNDADPGQLHTLFLVEGELNAISISQVTRGVYPCDVLSFGSQSNIEKADVARVVSSVSKRYKYVIVWADEPEIALHGKRNAVGTVRTMPVRTVVEDGEKYDANRLLQLKRLDDLVFELLKEVSR